MNNFSTPNLPGFEEWPSIKSDIIPDFQQLLFQKIQNNKTSTSTVDPNGFDPHIIMVKKNKEDKGEIPVDTTPSPKWPEKDLKALEDFCKQHNIIGFQCGRMHPAAALFMLKQKVGYTNIPLEDRVPEGYEKKGTPHPHNVNYSHHLRSDKRVILNG